MDDKITPHEQGRTIASRCRYRDGGSWCRLPHPFTPPADK
jgi:hypothetical protein